MRMNPARRMAPVQIDDETLMALADGEIDPLRADDLRRAIAADPALQARLHQFQETRRRLGQLRQTAPQDGSADPLAAMIRASVKPADAARVTPPPPANLNRRPWLAAAASVAVVALGLGWWNLSGSPAPGGFSAAELAALDALPSGQVQTLEPGTDLAMIASFRLADGAFCREFETAQGQNLRAVLACRQDGAWTERFAAMSQDGGQDYRPASGEGTMDQALADLGAGQPLTPEDEAQALRD